MKYLALALLLILICAVAAWFLRGKSRNASPPATQFHMPIDDVFAIKSISKVVVVGIVAEGEVRPGDRLLIRSGSQERSVTVEALERIDQPLKIARKGEQVAVMLIGADKDQISAGAILVSDLK
jgi:selenocysteine-specific translation elongation factor